MSHKKDTRLTGVKYVDKYGVQLYKIDFFGQHKNCCAIVIQVVHVSSKATNSPSSDRDFYCYYLSYTVPTWVR